MAIPLIAMIGLLAYVTSTQVDDAINLDRAPNLINATSLPATRFGNFLETERAAAVVYLSDPSAGNLQAYQAAIAATNGDVPAFKAAMTSPATISSETPDEAKAIGAIMTSLGNLSTLRAGVQTRAVSALDALNLYSQGIAAQPKLFLLMTNSEAGTSQQGQAIGLITIVQAREELSQEQALLAGVLAAGKLTKQDRLAFTNMVATRAADLQYAEFVLSPANLAVYNAKLSGSTTLRQQLGTIEQAVEAGTPASQLPITLSQWQSLTGTLLQDEYNGGVAISQAILVADHQTTHAAWVRVAVVGGIALLGLIVTVLLTTLLGRSIIRRLRGLETSALTLAQDQLPEVIGRLRRGEDVDVAIEAPPLQAGSATGAAGRDEIGRVSQAFDLVRQTALRAAVDEARLRQGINDVFRSLARRSQSLLHRQLTLLDQMERRATDPEALDDLFRLDHLTTRMRRHAEGLVILAGAPPSRGWSSPVRMIDVMRGAVAEVEDYARVSVATRSQALLSGSAVADVIHLLAELIENATTLSPPHTSVRVAGDTVANGFAIEVEDRGLGMNAQRLAELNDRLARPPEFNPSDSEQLGLFVVGQLAKRHGIRVTLKASPYGGTSAIVLIPHQLIVTDGAISAGPGEPAAITMAGAVANGHGAPPPAELDGGFGLGQALTGLRESSKEPVREKTGAGLYAAAPVPPVTAFGPVGAGLDGRGSDGASLTAGASGPEPFDAFLPLHRRDFGAPVGAPDGTDEPGAGTGALGPAEVPERVEWAEAPERAEEPEQAEEPGPVEEAGPQVADGGDSPYWLAGTQPRQDRPFQDEPSFPGSAFYESRRPAPGRADPGAPAAMPGWTIAGAPPVTPMKPVASPRPDFAPIAPWEREPAGPGGEPADEAGDLTELPRRVKQAHLAPQLRADPPRRQTIVASGGPVGGPAGGPSPAEIRQTMSALQRGWQEGRSQHVADAGDTPRVPTFTPIETVPDRPDPAAGASGAAEAPGPDGGNDDDY